MATLQKMSHDDPNWDVKFNNIIDYLANGEDSNFKWTDRTSTGLVFQNGFNQLGSDTDHMSTYRFVQFKGWKLVDLQIMVTLSAAPSSNNEVIAVSLPDSISYGGWHEWEENANYRLAINNTQFRISQEGNDGKWWFGDGSHYVAHIFYPHIDK